MPSAPPAAPPGLSKREDTAPVKKRKPQKKPTDETQSSATTETPPPHPRQPPRRPSKKAASPSPTTTETTTTPTPSPAPITGASNEKKKTSTRKKDPTSTPTTTPGTQRSQSSTDRRPPLFEEYLDLKTLQDGIAAGRYFRSKIRINPADRNQGFCTIPGLPHDVFIPGATAQNRSIEGDEVAIEILPLSLWKYMSPTTSSSYQTNNDIDGNNKSNSNDLVASPALIPSASGGELGISVNQPLLNFDGILEVDDDANGEEVVECVAEKIKNISITTQNDDPDVTLLNLDSSETPWEVLPRTAASPEQQQHHVIKILLSLLHGPRAGWRATANVVGILAPSPRRSTIVGVLKSYVKGSLLLIPQDPRLPRFSIPADKIPGNRSTRTQARGTGGDSHSSTSSDNNNWRKVCKEAMDDTVTCRMLVSASMTAWGVGDRQPKAQLCEIIGRAGSLQDEICSLLIQNGVHDDDEFTPEILACLPKCGSGGGAAIATTGGEAAWTIPDSEVSLRRDLRSWRIFSIDPPTARDLDDALSIEKLPDSGLYRIGVHIADVSYFVRPETALDTEASMRSTSVYLVDRVIPMLPRLLCEQLCSLNPGVDRLSFSIVWDMNARGEIQSTWAGRTIIRSCAKLGYPHVQELIDGENSPQGAVPPGVVLYNGHTWDDVANDALMLHSIACHMRKKRFEVDGALRLDNVRLFFELDPDTGAPIEFGMYQQKEANRLVEEFMLAANMTAARMISEAFPDKALLRRHRPPNPSLMSDLSLSVSTLLPNAPKLQVSSAAALQSSLTALRNALDPSVAEVVTLMCTKPMQLAQYFCTGIAKEPHLWRHYALAVNHYTHFTSPIRRYPDILVHRLLDAALAKAGGDSGAGEKLLGAEAVEEIAQHANERKKAAKSTQDGALKLYLASLLLSRPTIHTGVVVGMGGAKFFDAYVPKLGIDVRIYVDKLVVGGGGAVEADFHDDGKNGASGGGRGARKTLQLSFSEYSTPDMRTPLVDDIESYENLQNPLSIAPLALPVTLQPLMMVPVVVGGVRSQVSGSPTGVLAKIYLKQ